MPLRLGHLVPNSFKGLVRKIRFANWNKNFTPHYIKKDIYGVNFDFLIGDVVGKEWYTRMTYLEEMTFMHENMVVPGDIILECGAHHGFTTILLANWAGEMGQVVAFEVSPSSVRILQENILHNGLQARVHVEPKAVGPRNDGFLNFSDESAPFALVGQQVSAVRVPMVCLDSYKHLKPTLIKIDIEGYEIDALEGARQILESRPKLAIEVHVDMLPRYGHIADELFKYVNPQVYDLWLQLGGIAPRLYQGEKLSDQHMDQVHLYAIPK
jgi:FkbM family methyltransferase